LTTPAVSLSATDNVVCLTDGVVDFIVNPANAQLSGTGVSNGVFNPTVAGVGSFVVTASITDPNGCVGEDTLTIIVQQCAGISTNQHASFTVVPNPFSESFTLQGLVEGDFVSVVDLSGNVVVSPTNSSIIDTHQLAKGSYFIVVYRLHSKEIQLIVKI